MRLLRVRAEDFKGIDAYEVRFAEDGVTVVEAPNEAGKSSLMEAVGLLIHYKDSSSAKAVRVVAPKGRDVGSFIEVEMRCGPYHLTCRKRFHRQTMTELDVHAPRAEHHTGDEAHDRLQEILGETLDMALFEALWFQQGRSLDSLQLGDSSVLAAALDAEAGGTGDGGEDALLERVREEFERYYTPKGSEGKALREVDEAVEDAEQREAELRGRLEELEGDVEELARLEQEIERLREIEEELGPKLEEFRQLRDAIHSAREQVGTRRAQVEGAQAQAARAQDAVEARQELVQRLQELAGQIDELEAQIAPEDKDLQQVTERLEDLRQQRDQAEEAVQDVRDRVRAQQDVVDLLRKRAEHARLAAQQERVEGILERAGKAEAFLEACRLTDGILNDIRRADEDRRTAQATLDVGAPTVEVEARRDLRLSVDGQERELGPDASQTFTVGDRLRLDVPDVVGLEVRAGTSVDELRENIENAERRLAEACERGGVADLAEAQEVAEQRRGHEEALQRCEQDLESVLDGRPREELKDSLRVVSRQIADLEERVGDLADGTGLDAAEKTLAELRQSEQETSAEVERLQREREALRDATDERRQRVTRLRVELESRRDEHGRLRGRLEAARQDQDDEDLARADREAARRLEDAQAELASAEEELEGLDPQRVELQADNVEKQHERTKAELRDAQDRRLQLRTRLDMAGQDGLGERLAAAQTELEHARSTQRRVRSRAAAAQMLYEELSAAREEAYRAYRAPLRDGIVRLGRIVFGSSLDVVLDEELSVVERTLDGTTLPWESLSSGAKEQLAVLTALAATQLAADDGVPLILDDTLGYTDPERLERLGAVLSHVQASQVVVLTCVADRYRHVGGAHVLRLRQARPVAAAGRPARGPGADQASKGLSSAAASQKSLADQTLEEPPPDRASEAPPARPFGGDGDAEEHGGGGGETRRETLTCQDCGRDWSRTVKPGRKPSRCPDCQ